MKIVAERYLVVDLLCILISVWKEEEDEMCGVTRGATLQKNKSKKNTALPEKRTLPEPVYGLILLQRCLKGSDLLPYLFLPDSVD